MASLVGAILFLRPFTLPIFHSPFPTSISHFHFPLSFTTPQVATLCPLPYGCYPLPDTLWLRVCTPSGQCHSCTRFLSCQNRFPMALRCNAPASNSSATAPRPTAPPYLRPMRLLHGRVRRYWVLGDAVAKQGRRCWVANDAAGCPWRRCWVANAAVGCPRRSSCKSPRARILVLGTSGAHWSARWPRFELTERVAKS